MPRQSYYLGNRQLVSQDDAAIIAPPRVPRSRFTNRWSHLKTFDAGYLYPFLVDEIMPGDHVRYNVTAYVRMSTALFPIFSNQRFDTFIFFVPYRLLWDKWVKIHGEQVNPADTIVHTMPAVGWSTVPPTIGSIYDHFALPIAANGAGGVSVNALPLRAYNMIYNHWFRDQNVINSVWFDPTSNTNSISDFALLRRAKPHDYFTSALPWPQKFTPLQTLFTGTAPVVGIGIVDNTAATNLGPATVRESDGGTDSYAWGVWQSDAANKVGFKVAATGNINAGNPPLIFADLSQATGVTINALRNAWLVQDLLERDARGGTRYVEQIKAQFGVVSPDFRLARPEYIGGGQTPLNITPVAQTATGGGGLGALGGIGAAVGNHSASYAATEHGVIIGICNVRTELHYQQGLHRMWSKSTRYDYYTPALAGLGEQAILRREIYCTGVTVDDNTVFGYQERWHEYRTRYSEVTGLFRSTSAGNIDEWHLAEQFSAAPTLSQSFLEENPPMSRVLAAGGAAANMQYLADILIDRTITRPVPMFGTPATLARF